MTMAVAGGTGEDQNYHVGAKSPNVIHHVAKDLVTIPFLKRLVGGFREAEIDGE